MGGLPAPAWYSEHVLTHAEPGPPLWPDKGPARQWRQWWSWQATGDDPAQRLARTQGFVVTTGQLRNLGWRRHDDRRERRRGTWTPVGSSCRSPVRAASDAADRFVVRRREHALSAAAAALVRRDHAVTGRSAAVLHGLPTLRLPEQPELTASAVALGRRGRAHVFGARLPAEDVTQWFGTPVSTVARTVVDMARHDRRDGLVVADAAMHEKLVTREQLRAVLRGAAGWPGVRQARAIVDLADARAESPLESLLRLALHEDGFPAPDLQVVIHDPVRRRSYRIDLLFADARLILEADGAAKYTAEEVLREKRRETRLRALGYRVERLMWEDVTRYWAETSSRLRLLLHDR